MGPFAGYNMPIQYPLGVLKEHLHTRNSAGLFDVSHMGQIVLRSRDGVFATAAAALERLVPVDVLDLAPGRQRYAVFTNERGGIIDDLMIGNRGDHLLLIVNASRKDDDELYLREHLASVCEIDALPDRALIALQGPASESVLARLSAEVRDMRFMDLRNCALGGIACVVSRSGYTGEDGYEIGLLAADAEWLASRLLAQAEVTFVGLGARDSLRLEAGLCLYGVDLDETTTPVEAGIAWAIPKVRRAGGARAGNFVGAAAVLADFAKGTPRLFVGLRPNDRTVVRGGAKLFADASALHPIGTVTSGGFGPSMPGPVAMGYVVSSYASNRTQLFAEVRGNRVAVSVVPLPFVPHRYKR
jgi:aminomethyltransferase